MKIPQKIIQLGNFERGFFASQMANLGLEYLCLGFGSLVGT